MALQYHPLPLDVFPEEARPHIARHNAEIRNLFALEGCLLDEREVNRSDRTIARGEALQVHTSRITPSITQVVSGQSTVVGTPALTLGTVNTAGSTTTAVSVNSAIALFGLGLPAALAGTAAVGTSAFAARADHVHLFPTTLRSTANASTLALTDDGAGQILTGSLGILNLRPSTGLTILPGPSSQTIIDVDSTTGPTQTCLVRIRPAASNFTGLAPNYFTADVSSNTVRAWDVIMTHASSGVLTSATLVGYDMSVFAAQPAAGSDTSNIAYGARIAGALITHTASTGWSDVSGLYITGPRRGGISAPTVTLSTGATIECPTISGTTQIGVYIKQRTAQVAATNRAGIWIDAQNSGTNRWSIYGVSDRAQFTGPLVCDGAFGATGFATFGNSMTLTGTLDHNGARAGLYGATPAVQFGTTGTEAGFAAGTSTTVTVDSTFTGNTGTTAYTLGDIVRSLKLLGAIAY